MSLDVCLTVEEGIEGPTRSRIYIREDGQNKEITRAEWDERFPGREPVTVESEGGGEVFSANTTHNLGKMALEAGIYEALWRPDENGIKKAWQLVVPLREGLELLTSDPERFKAFNPQNGWGTYEGLVGFISRYLEACRLYPNADVSVSR